MYGTFFSVARNYYELFNKETKILVAGGPIYNGQFKNIRLNLPYDIMIQGESKCKSKFKYFRNAKVLFEQSHGDIIVIQQGGVITSFIAILLFYHKKSRLFLIQYSKEGVSSMAKRLLYTLVKYKIDGIICPNDMVGNAYGKPYCVVPDYIYIPNTNNKIKTYSEKKYDICFVGRIEEEKGVLDVAHKIAGTKYKMIIAGKIRDESLQKRLENLCLNCSNIELNIGYISDETYYNILRDSRFCILNYQGEYSKRSSGVVLDTIFSDVPIVGKRCTALNFVEDNNVGFIYEDLAKLNLDEVMNEAFYQKCLDNIKTYKQKHSEYKLKLASFLGISK